MPSYVQRTVQLSGDSPRASAQVTAEFKSGTGVTEAQESSLRLAMVDQDYQALSSLSASLGKGSTQTPLVVNYLTFDFDL